MEGTTHFIEVWGTPRERHERLSNFFGDSNTQILEDYSPLPIAELNEALSETVNCDMQTFFVWKIKLKEPIQ